MHIYRERYIYICMHIYIYIYIYVYVCMHAYMYTSRYTLVFLHIPLSNHVSVCLSVYLSTSISVSVSISISISMSISISISIYLSNWSIIHNATVHAYISPPVIRCCCCQFTSLARQKTHKATAAGGQGVQLMIDLEPPRNISFKSGWWFQTW